MMWTTASIWVALIFAAAFVAGRMIAFFDRRDAEKHYAALEKIRYQK